MGGLSHREATLKAGFLTAVALVRVLVAYILLVLHISVIVAAFL